MKSEISSYVRYLIGIRYIIPIVIILVSLAVLVVGARKMSNPARRANSVQVFLPSVQSNSTPEPLVVEELTLRPIGFHPSEIRRPKGKFLLAINNRAGLQEMNITISREIGSAAKERLKNVKVHNKYLDWNDVLDLQPGDYVVTEASNPMWVCRIIVTPK
ncbi:MAG: hypothetical protein L0220_17360 [Acidobacteria bacterium]|nr:hypothetical protein [Acidobacteriota bacterium]